MDKEAPMHLMALGLFLFQIPTLAHDELQRKTDWRFARSARGARDAVQFLGAGDEKISLSGSVYAEITDGRVSLDQLREMADQGEALPLLDGSGLVFGSFVIEAIDERHAGLMADGRPLRIDFAIDLLRVDDPAGALPAQHGMTTLTNIPDWRVTLDGTDLTERMRPRLVSLAISEKRGDEADQLDIVLDDADGLLAIPPEGARLLVMLGWKQGRDVAPGLVHKGSFKVDEVNHSGPPDQIRIRARAADFTSAIRNRREQSWANTTLGTVLQDIAGRNALSLRIAPDLAAIALPALHQSRESDTAFLRRLGRENDAVATIKTGTLIFARKGAGTTSTGQPLPTLALTRRSGDGHSWQRQTRDGQAGVTAHWHDRKAATTRRHHGQGRRRENPAQDLPRRSQRPPRRRRTPPQTRPATLDMRLALGRPDAIPEARVTLTGFKPEIDATPWLITEVTHRLDNAGGFITELKMETAGSRRQFGGVRTSTSAAL
jgi:phage protein D/phage protein U